MFVGTIHAFCLELLKSEVPTYLKYEVLNEVQQALFVDRHSKQSGLTTSTALDGKSLKRYSDTLYYIAALSILREADREEDEIDGCSILDGLEVYAGSSMNAAISTIPPFLKMSSSLTSKPRYAMRPRHCV